jgi:AhpD family alkylhydroperoxidase
MRRILLLSLALPTTITGAWALLAPASWHGDFPCFGRDWLPFFGAYNEHLARDYGGALLALGVLLAWPALSPRVRLTRAIPAAFLAFALPHFVFHVANAGELPAGDEVVNLVTLALSVLIPVALLLLPSEEVASVRAPESGRDGRRLPPARPRGIFARGAYAISRRRFGHVLGPLEMSAHNPPILKAYSLYELLLERADSIDPRLENLAAQRAATMTGCPFCIDYGEGHLPELGLSAQQVRDVPNWRDSDAFSDDERLVLEYAEQISDTPVAVDDELFDRLRERFDEAAIVELTAAIAFENYRGRFNHALGLGAEGFCDISADGRPETATPDRGLDRRDY